MNNPTIIVIAYKRHASLDRLLNSLSCAEYPNNDIELLISIDRSDNPKVLETAVSFNWTHGKKEIVAHEETMGLRRHILSCGDLAEQFGSVILLEDDLYVSPLFYRFSLEGLRFYDGDKRIAGISLYSHRTNVNCYRPFEPVYDGTDVFFFRFASSWGQVWTAEQWRGFRSWYDAKPGSVTFDDNLPVSVVNWPETSWLKYFIKYMVCNELYFVYPRDSLTTNYGEPGTHNRGGSHLFQVPLQIHAPIDGWRFARLEHTLSIYDVFFELAPSSFAEVVPNVSANELTVDLYGTKPLDSIHTPYLLTCRPSVNPLDSFGCSLKPREANILFRSAGCRFVLSRTEKVREMGSRPEWELEFDLNLIPERALYKYVLGHMARRIKRKILH